MKTLKALGIIVYYSVRIAIAAVQIFFLRLYRDWLAYLKGY